MGHSNIRIRYKDLAKLKSNRFFAIAVFYHSASYVSRDQLSIEQINYLLFSSTFSNNKLKTEVIKWIQSYKMYLKGVRERLRQEVEYKGKKIEWYNDKIIKYKKDIVALNKSIKYYERLIGSNK